MLAVLKGRALRMGDFLLRDGEQQFWRSQGLLVGSPGSLPMLPLSHRHASSPCPRWTRVVLTQWRCLG